jgi:hypothetical protein
LRCLLTRGIVYPTLWGCPILMDEIGYAAMPAPPSAHDPAVPTYQCRQAEGLDPLANNGARIRCAVSSALPHHSDRAAHAQVSVRPVIRCHIPPDELRTLQRGG